MRVYHLTPKWNVRGVLSNGIDPECSQGRCRVCWVCVLSEVRDMMEHIAGHQKCRADQLRLISADVPRGWLKRRRTGVYTCDRLIPASRLTVQRLLS